MEIRYNELPLHTEEMSEALKEQLHQKWVVEKGIELVSFDVNSANTTEENEKLIRDAQAEARYQHAGLGAAALTAALVGQEVLGSDYKKKSITIAFNPIDEVFEQVKNIL